MKASTTSYTLDAIDIGNGAHILAIALNVLVTSAVILQLPSKEIFDETWREQGQCLVSHGPIDTTTICGIMLCSSALGLFLLSKKLSKNGANNKNNEQLASRLQKMGESNLSHGLGHEFIHFYGSIPRVEISLRPDALGYLLVLLVFWPTTLRALVSRFSTRSIVLATILIVGFQAAIDIEPHLQFSFTQAIILMLQSLDQLTLPKQKKSELPLSYLIFAVYHLPLFAFMWLEVTRCSEWVAAFGGHAIYDFYLSIGPFVMANVLQKYEFSPNTCTENKGKKQS
eukprot:CAMPEP_0197715692 /NCGR_PEP_ID=MMETSP1434-20131217/800_1 /TAXON_ID=265543 /ORGANISM="Minutocellus polymorphus, Strain CCMP3303" /LENGTH=283 /DNA_ID=CAMNT_0043299885 /DNA_START=42 /DNA_END=893 /DNA_ORIENTATION=+